MMRLAIIGSGDLAEQIAYYAISDSGCEIVGFYNDFLKKGVLIDSKVILGSTDDILNDFNNNIFDKLVVGIGYKHFDFREKIFNLFKNTIPFANIIHSTSYIDPSVNLGEGIVVFPGTIIDKNVDIKDNVFIHISCTIAHDSCLDRHSFLSPAVKIAGFVKIGKKCNLGINSTIIDSIILCDSVQTGGGTVIIESINNPGLYVGNPQRFIR